LYTMWIVWSRCSEESRSTNKLCRARTANRNTVYRSPVGIHADR